MVERKSDICGSINSTQLNISNQFHPTDIFSLINSVQLYFSIKLLSDIFVSLGTILLTVDKFYFM